MSCLRDQAAQESPSNVRSKSSFQTRSARSSNNFTSSPSASNAQRDWEGYTKKGDVLSVARIAGIMAAKKTADIVPLAHPGLGITGVEVDIQACPSSGSDPESVHCFGRTGVEMEALTSVVGGALTVFDMCKAVDKGMVIGEARVVRKKGGKSGDWEEAKRVGGGGV
uniref:Molybdenum cofactor biosynthesis protein 1 B n=1 Tax=Coccidioides posadasii RMSCC 3488 TaxID=454284 RepID=A0A0J6FTC0_COCPO|nr:molybdenum cofactor biosynthesis protein 1 B [Coccidioides posadasii RMSCC 3488]